MRSFFNVIMFAVFAASVFAINVSAQDKGKELRSAIDRVDKASDVIKEVMKISERSIPRDLLSKAKAIVVFPGTLKVGFIVGGQGGSGVAIRRLDSGWSAPAFLNMAGGSIGPQVGGQKTDYVLLVMNENGLDKLLRDKFEIGGEGSVSAGPVGRTASATTNARLDAEILSYSRSKGLFAGISLKGVVISQDEDMNQAIYEKSARQLLVETPIGWADAPASLQKFPKTVATYTR
ncbi:MAG TPA: lipid-binding SYLF domain-containing protein [Pyrinomonadaceae bacterium]|nr:lipid-binding SYLF domain-containing protein [Chloracidobacterium sp.]HRJ89182.1 lipid-binding SYLF domain-containing protein [Pyrinomonadaceae bacterium]HRK52088.1 lipid-binding SYLF domain-containing protein [Pyrinomonadaceae bacterium]